MTFKPVLSPLPRPGIRRTLHLAAVVLLGAPGLGQAQAPRQNSPPRHAAPAVGFTGPLADYRASITPMLAHDFGERYLYAPADAALPPPRPGEARVVFLGDSITDLWDLAAAFPGKPYVNRGIGGQVSAQMVLRFQQDVVALRPKVVVILAGINDLPGVLQVESDAGIESNYRAMAQMARANRIRVVFASVTPVNAYTDNARTMLQDRPPARIDALNAWLKAYAARCGATYADYHAAMTDGAGLLRRELTQDGLHPNAQGYAVMAPIAARAVAAALARPLPPAVCAADQD